MSIESIGALGAGAGTLPAAQVHALPELTPPAMTDGSSSESAFHSLLSAIGTLNQDLQTGEQGLQRLAAGGEVDNLHQSLMGMERMRLTLQLLLQVRSRALEAYQELTRMQI